jgi:hypothetical protein
VVVENEQNTDPSLAALVVGDSPNPSPTASPIGAMRTAAVLSPLAASPSDSAVEEDEIETPTGVIPPVEDEQEQDENEEETPRRASPCSKLAAFASRLFKRIARSSAAKNKARQAPACVDLAYLPAVLTMEGYSIVVIAAVENIDQQEAASAEDSSSIPISPTTTTTTPPSHPTDPQGTATGTGVAAGSSSVVALDQSEARIDGAPSSSPPSPSPSCLSRAKAVISFPGKLAVNVARGSAKMVRKTMRKGLGLVKGVGSIVWQVLRAIGWGVRRVLKVLLNGTWSREEMELMREEEEEEEVEVEEEGVMNGVGVGGGE